MVRQLLPSKKNRLDLPDRQLAAQEVVHRVHAVETNLEKTIHCILEQIGERLGYFSVAYYQVEESQQSASLSHYWYQNKLNLVEPAFVVDASSNTLAGTCLQKKDPQTTKSMTFHESDPRRGDFIEKLSGAIIPLIDSNGVIGMIELFDAEQALFTNSELDMLKKMGDWLSISIQNANQFSMIQKDLDRYRGIQHIHAAIDEPQTIEEVLHHTVQSLALWLPGSRVAFLTPERRGALRVRAYAGYANADSNTLQLKSGGGAAGSAARLQKPVLTAESGPAEDNQGLSPDSQSILCVPILLSDRLFGVINIEHPHSNHFSQGDLDFVIALAKNTASILSNLSFLDQIHLQVEQQKQLYEITNKIRHSFDVDLILRTTAEEICTSLNLRKATIHIHPAALSSTGKAAVIQTSED